MRQRIWAGSISAAALIGASFVIPQVASAQPAAESWVVGADDSSVDTTLVQDVTLIAEGVGMTTEEAADAFAGQAEFVQAASAAYGAHPDLFFSSGWTPERLETAGYKAWVSFAGPIPATTIETFATLPIPVEVRFDAPASAEALEPLREEVLTSLHENLPGAIGVTGDFAENGDLLVQYEAEASARRGVAEVSPSDVVEAVVESSPIDIIIAPADGIAAEEEIVRGGVAFGGCTLGFAARRGNTPGGVTAGHCNNSSAIPAESSTPMPYVTGHEGAYGDAQFHSTTDGLSSAIRTSSAGTRTITGTAWPSNGMSVCNKGKTRVNSGCTTVRNWNHAFTNTNGVYLSRMAQSNGSFTNPGDSGGPWYSGSTAIGVHFGKSGGYSTMSRVPDVEAILSVTIARN